MNKKSETDTIKKVAKKTKSDTNKRVTKKTETDTNKRVTKKTETNTNKDINKKVETVRRFFSDSKASNHPVKEHPISKTDEYIRNMYFDMLCVAAQYESDDTENAFTLIKRIMSACKNVQPFEEYIRRSMELTVGKTAEFIKQCRDNKLCEIFFVDSLLISCSNGTPNAKQIAFLAQYGDMLGFKKAEMTEISEFAAAILKQDSDGYQKILNKNNAYIQEAVLCYTKEFVEGMILNTSKKLYYYSQNFKEFDNINILKDYDEIKIENMKIRLKQKEMHISSVKNLILENCYVLSTTLCLSSIEKIKINNCNFKWDRKPRYTYEKGKSNVYYCNRAIEADLYNSKIMISNTKFSDFSIYSFNAFDYRLNGFGVGAVFCAYGKQNDQKNDFVDITFENCEFTNIQTDCEDKFYEYGYSVFYASPLAYYYEVSVKDCYFSNCKTTYNSTYTKYLFGYNFIEFKAKNNKLIDSDILGEHMQEG